MWWLKVSLLAVIGLILVGSPPWHDTLAFNVETKHYAVYKSEAKSMFGFAVTAYRDRYGRGWAIVGAPEAETPQAGVYRGGAVYKCNIDTDYKCDLIPFDKTGHNRVKNPDTVDGTSQVDNKTLQWFGATVSASSRDGGSILACAPRYTWFNRQQGPQGTDYIPGNRRDPVGTCWLNENFANPKEFSPCRTRNWGYHRQGSCQAGLGAALSKNGDRIFIGAPGSWYWQGQLYSVDKDVKFWFVVTDTFSGQVSAQTTDGRSKVIFTKEGPASEDDSYMGYSVASGDFIGDGDSGIAVGVPRGSGLRGKVVLFTSNMKNHQNITGEQMGAYFGYSVASCDVDGDNLDDLLVGAPMYTIPDNPEMTIETGRIYVIYQGRGPEKYRKVDIRDGESNRGRFGLSLASLGDIDLDGYGDFAVGAPYGGPNGRGVVYVYHGSEKGVLEKYSQAIYAEDLDIPVRTFGFSVSGGLDMDGNRYPDMVVGSYESNTAMFFRSRPVIKMDSYVIFDSQSKLISLDNKNCTLSDGTRVTCLPLRACFKYHGDGVLPRHNFDIQYVLDVKKTKNPRLFFLELEGKNTMNHTITVERDQQFCRTVQVYVTSAIRDKLTSLDAEMRMSLTEERIPDTRRRDPKIPLRPVLGVTTSRKDSLSIRKNCGPDNICIPDLKLKVIPNVTKYLLGSAQKLQLEIIVENNGEDAFEATYNLRLPAGIDYIKIERVGNGGIPVQCSAPKQSNNKTLKCDIGNPLPQSQLVRFNVLLQPLTSDGMKPYYDFDMEVNTTNPEKPETMQDNKWFLSLPIWVETELRIVGESKPKDIYYDPNNYTTVNVSNELEFGPAMTHNYTIRNQGPSDVLLAEAFLVWPAQTLAGDELVYLLEQPETSATIACAPANSNYLRLKLEHRKKVYYDYSDTSGVILDESRTGINVQRGFDSSQKNTSKEESEMSTGDSSSMQKSRQSSSSSSSETHRTSTKIQISSGEDSKVLLTIYNQSSSDSSSTGSTGDFSSGNTRVILDARSSSYGTSTSLDGLLTTIQGNTFGPSQISRAFQQEIQQSQNQGTEINWSRTSSERPGPGVQVTQTDQRYQEVVRQQEEQRRRLEEEARRQDEIRRQEAIRRENEAIRQRQEEDRIRRLEEERRIAYQQQQQRQREEERRREKLYREEERRRQQERQEEHDYEDEKIYDSPTETQDRSRDGLIIGDREETIRTSDIGLRLHNASSTQELERFFGALSKDRTDYRVYSRQGQRYVQFRAKFRMSNDRKEYIQFEDGSTFPLQDDHGRQSYVSLSSEPRDSRFLRMEGQLLISQDGKGYIVLKDGRRFPLQGSYTYTEERSYNLGDGTRGSTSSRTTGDSYDRTWHEESTKHDESEDYDFYDSRTHEERRSEERRTNSRTYSRSHGHDRLHGDDVAVDELDPNHLNSRFRRESDMVEIDDFKKFEKRHRHRREVDENYPFDDTLIQSDNKDGVRSQNDIPPCNAAKCVTLRCVLGPLKKDEEVWIAARYRVNAMTMKKVAFNEKVKVSTQLIAKVTKQPFIGAPSQQVMKSYETYTNVEPSAPPAASDVIPLWVVVLSACAGTIILLLLIFLLYKCGFFKRNRPSDAPERQPLNRNGHFQQGDDHM